MGQCVTSRLINGGQSCIAAKRFIVTPGHLEEFEQRVVEALAEKRVGDPLDETTDVGPMARADLRDELHEQVVASIEGGACCLLGGGTRQLEAGSCFVNAFVRSDPRLPFDGIKE